jgi:hypothetical protein
MRSFFLRLVAPSVGVLVLLAVAAACSSSTSSGGVGGAGGDAGGDGGGGDDGSITPDGGSGADSGGDGSASGDYTYPPAKTGWRARSGGAPGDVIPNVSLQGYRANQTTLTTIALADYWDRKAATRDAVVIILAGAWDPHSPEAVNAALASTKRISTLCVLGEGVSLGAKATSSDLSQWRTAHPAVDNALDPGFVAFGQAFDQSALPFMMVLDARTMEITYASLGAMQSTDIDAEVTKITSRPPSF